jgi:hypothetical protein
LRRIGGSSAFVVSYPATSISAMMRSASALGSPLTCRSAIGCEHSAGFSGSARYFMVQSDALSPLPRRAASKLRGNLMSIQDDIAQESQRITERLERLDAERAKLAEELAELEATERVLSRLAEGRPRRGRRARAQESAEPVAPGRRGRRGRAKEGKAAMPSLPIGDATLRAVEAHGNGISAAQIRDYLAQELGLSVRLNHLGMALQRHRRAGRLEERNSQWWVSQPPAG